MILITKRKKRKKINFDGNKFLYKNLKYIYSFYIFFFPIKNVKYKVPSTPKILYVHRNWGIDTGVINYTIGSLKRYCVENNFLHVCLQNDVDFFEYLKDNVLKFGIDVLVFDVRMMLVSSYWYEVPKILYKSRKIANLCAKNNIKIICQSTDFFQFSDRIISSLLTSNFGTVVSIATLPETNYYPHKRVIGPCPAIVDFDSLEVDLIDNSLKDIDVFLGGLLYGKREIFYKQIHDILQEKGIKSFFVPKKDLKTYQEYLDILRRSKIVVTTNFFSNDNSKIQMNGKCVEAPLMGALLFAQESPALNNFFINGEEYISFSDLNNSMEVADKIIRLIEENELLCKISKAGHDKVINYINSNQTWSKALLLNI